MNVLLRTFVPLLVGCQLLFTSLAIHVQAQDNAQPETKKPAPVKREQLGSTNNVHACGKLFTAGQPTQQDVQTIKERGVQRVITLRAEGEVNWDESAAFKQAGLKFEAIPIASANDLTDEVFTRVRKLLGETEQTPTLLHCGSANRVGAVWLTYRVLDEGVSLDQAITEAKSIGLRSAEMEAKARDYIQRQSK